MQNMNLKATVTNAINTNRRSSFRAPNMAVFARIDGDVTFVAENANYQGSYSNPYGYGVGVMIGFSRDTNDSLVAMFARAFKV